MTLIIAAKAAYVPSQLEDRISKGFRAVEIITFEDQLKYSFESMQKILRDYSSSLEFTSIHTPSELTISDAIDQRRRERGLLCLERAIQLAALIDCKRVVFHAFQSVLKLGTIDEMISLRNRAFQKCVEGIRSLIYLCEDLGMMLCLENINTCIRLNEVLHLIFTASPNDLLRVIREVRSDSLKLCFDVAHAQNVCNFLAQHPKMRAFLDIDTLTPEGFLELIIDHTDLIHMSDCKGVVAGKGTDNLPLGQGEIDFRKVLELVLTKGLGTPIVLEIDENDVNDAVNMAKSREFLMHIISELEH